MLGTWLPSSLLTYTRGETAEVSGEGTVNTTHHFLHAIQVCTFCGVNVKNIRKPELEEVCFGAQQWEQRPRVTMRVASMELIAWKAHKNRKDRQ